MTLTVEIDPARRTAAFREVSFLVAGDSCRVVLDGVRGADFGSLALLLYRDAASESPVASCSSFSPVGGHPALADGELALDTSEMAAWFADAVPEESDDSDDSDDSDGALPSASASAEPRLAARASLAERSVRADGWLVVLDRDRTWAACRVPVLLRPGAGASGVEDPTSVRALVEGLVSAALADKADKAAPAAAGNLASLDASGNLSDSGATPASIKAAAVAEVVANAPGTMDTLKEIADILGSVQQSGTVLKRISDLESSKADSSSLARVATSGSYNDLTGKPTVPAAVEVDATLTTQGAAADAKAVGDVLRSGFTPWELSSATTEPLPDGIGFSMAYDSTDGEWILSYVYGGQSYSLRKEGSIDDTSVVFDLLDTPVFKTTRHLITPTKTSQLTNDGAPNGGGTPYATTAHVAEKTVLVPEFSDWTYSPHYSDDIYVIWYNGGWYLHGFEESGTPPFSTDPNAISLAISTPFGEAVATRSLTGYVLGDQKTRPLQPKTALDDAPTASSVNPVKSGGVYSALQDKADKVAGATAGNLAALDAQGNLTDSGVKASDFASKDDLPYALVKPGEWEFSDGGSHTINGPNEDQDGWVYQDITGYYSQFFDTEANALAALSLTFTDGALPVFTATRASLPGHLLDRAVNAVPVDAATMLTLPGKMDGKSRDFYVRLTVGAESAVTFSATDSGGDAVSWDSMGSPSGTFAAGTYLYRFTEVAAGVFHAADVTSGGSVDPAVLAGKLEATSAAPAFDQTLTYIAGEYVTYGGILYRCKIAVTVAGPWTGDSNWVDVDMTSPDATLDVRSDGRLAVVAADSEILWIQGYDMASASDVVLSCEKVNFYAFASGTVTQTFNMPSAPGGKVGDFVLDIDNSANASTAATATLNGFGTSFDVIVPKGQNLFTDILSFEGGEMCELYFTMTAFGTAAKPAWKVVKQVVEKQEAGS